RCECAGECGKQHYDGRRKDDQDERCGRDHYAYGRLYAIPRTAVSGVAAMRLGPADLIAVCADCRGRIMWARSAAEPAAADQRLRDSEPLFEMAPKEEA